MPSVSSISIFACAFKLIIHVSMYLSSTFSRFCTNVIKFCFSTHVFPLLLASAKLYFIALSTLFASLFAKPKSNAILSIFLKSTPYVISNSIYGFASISAIASFPNVSYTFLLLLADIPNFSKKPTISHRSHFSANSSEIFTAFAEFIPLIFSSFSGSKRNTCKVSSPNFSIIFFAVAGPTPVIIPPAKYLSKASNVSGIIFSNVSILNCLP